MDDRRELLILGAPMESEALLEGVNLMPAALRAAGLVEALTATDRGDLPIAITDSARDPATGLVAYGQICAATELLRDALLELLAGPELPLIVGGCCGILVGIFAALQRRLGRCGLAFIDGHYDFYEPGSGPAAALADSELRVLTGSGPAALTRAGGAAPLLEAGDAWLLACRDGEEMRSAGAPDPLLELPAAHVYDDAELRAAGAAAVGAAAAAALAAAPGRYWLHLDLDALSAAAMPAVDYRLPGGLDWGELAALLRPLAASPALLGLDVTIYNPSLDPERTLAGPIVALLAEVLGGRA